MKNTTYNLCCRNRANGFHRILLLLLYCSFSYASLAQTPALSKKEIKSVDSLMHLYLTENRVPGATVAIVKNNELVLERGYGMADIEQFVPATPATVYRLASVSKPITAVAVMQLVEQGKLELDAPVQKYVPDFPQKKYPITTRQLLAHLSGIRHYQGEEFLSIRSYNSLKESLNIFKNDTLLHRPGAAQTYSTYGYTLLGVLVEAVSGKPFMDYLQEFIFKPAGMLNTYQDDPQQIITNRSAFYDKVDGKLTNSLPVNTSYKVPGGGLLSDANDMARFMIALQQGKLLKPATWNHMITEVKTSKGEPTHYGLGWILGVPPLEGVPSMPTAVWHGGVQQGSTTSIMLLKDKGMAVVVLSNLGSLGNEITATTALISAALMTDK